MREGLPEVRLPDGEAGSDGWRRTIAARARGFKGRIVYYVMWAAFAAALMGTTGAAMLAALWLLGALGVQLVEASALRGILKRRLHLSSRDRVEAVCWTLLSGLFPAAMIGVLSAHPDENGARATGILLFFAMAIYYLPTLRDARPLYAAAVFPGFLAAVAPGILWLLAERGDFLAALIVMAACGLVALQLISVSKAFYSNTNSLRDARSRALSAADRAESANRAKSDFLAVMSHELRTPMNAMLGSAELLRRTDLSIEQRGHLEALIHGGDVLMTLLNDVLDMAKIEAGAMQTEQIPVNIRTLADSLERLWIGRAREKGLDLVVEVDPETPIWIEGDPTRLRQILFNLLSNAVKFTNTGSVTLHVFVRRTASGSPRLIMDVRDTGIGVSPETAAVLFKPFQQAQVSTTRRFGGTGLGLSICKGLVRTMQGDITLTSEPGFGATFRVDLPLRQAEAPDAAADCDAAIEHVSAQILVAEDHPANRRVLGALLQPLGFEIIMACDGKEAVEMSALEEFDVILMDVHMPEMDGIEATRAIRAMSGWGAEVPIIALTANASENDRQVCLRAGMTDFATKPVDPRALHALIARYVNMARQGGARAAA